MSPSLRRSWQSGWFVLAVLLIWGSGEQAARAGQPLAREVEPNGTSATATPIAGTNVVIQGNLFPGLATPTSTPSPPRPETGSTPRS